MIALLVGQPIVVDQNLVVMVGGVGYDVNVTPDTLEACSRQKEVRLYIHTHVRDQAIELYGFGKSEDRKLFELLMTVSGIGPSTALAITQKGASAIIKAVQQAEVSFFSKIPRVGKKTAQKIIIELRGKLGSLKELDLTPLSDTEQTIVEALGSLGFSPEETSEVVRSLDTKNKNVEVLIQQAIKKIGAN